MPPTEAIVTDSGIALANRDTVRDLITAFGWRGRRGLSVEVAAHRFGASLITSEERAT